VEGLDTQQFPVEQVRWYDAVDFCNKLSGLEKLPPYYKLAARPDADDPFEVTVLGGKGYRLPTEAEWEFACRAGTTSAFHFGDVNNGVQSNVRGLFPYGTATQGPYLRRTSRVESYKECENPFGLFDMHGNVWEWCEDWYDEGYYAKSPAKDPVNEAISKYRVVRGGSWFNYPSYSRAALRLTTRPDAAMLDRGFRVARSL
jgi:formylglycine-generating enzyme required for sulfatase activity